MGSDVVGAILHRLFYMFRIFFIAFGSRRQRILMENDKEKYQGKAARILSGRNWTLNISKATSYTINGITMSDRSKNKRYPELMINVCVCQSLAKNAIHYL